MSRIKKKGTINLSKSKQINEDNNKNLKLIEEYSDKINRLEENIKEVITILKEYGQNITPDDAELILNAELNSDIASLTKIFNDLGVAQITDLLKNFNFDKAYREIKSSARHSNALGNIEGKLLNELLSSTYKSAEDLKKLFSPQLIEIEKKSGSDLATLKEKFSIIAKFHELYDDIIKMDPSSPQAKDASSAKYTGDQEWIKTAKSFLSSIQEFFGFKNQEVVPTTKTEMEEIEECSFMGLFCTTKQQLKTTEIVETETNVLSSWKINLDPIKWLDQYTNSQITEENLETEKSEDEINNDQVNEDGEYNLDSNLVAKKIHSDYQSLLQFDVTLGKLACFSTVMFDLKKTSQTCAIERTKKATAKFTSTTQSNVEADEDSVESTSVVVFEPDSQALIQANNNDDKKYTEENCETMIQDLYTLAENCNDVFWMDTIFDNDIQEGLNKAVLTEAKVNDYGNVVLVSSDGLEIEMTFGQSEFSSNDFAQITSSISSSGESSDMLMIDQN